MATAPKIMPNCVTLLYLLQEVKDNNDITMAADVKKLNNFFRILYLQNARLNNELPV